MPWDNTKATEDGDGTVDPNEQLTASEWNQHVTDGHFPSDNLNFGVDSGDPVITDPQNGDEIIARYDRATGNWVLGDTTHESVSTGNLDFGTVSEKTIIQSSSVDVVTGSYTVSTSNVDILGGAEDYYAVVKGRIQGDNDTFVDTLLGVSPGLDSPLVANTKEYGTPAARSYGNISTSTPMSMASGTYDVTAIAFNMA